tara:strand:- start:399 stop:1310 length:912 start_codon:yes stop_codon:yes gene_type:complete
MLKIFITGASGLLGSNFIHQSSSKNKILIHQNQRKIRNNEFITFKFDISKRSVIRDTLIKNTPDVIINSCGITDIDKCNKNPDLANYINAKIPQNLAYVASDLGIKFVQISTDHLFDGTTSFVSEEAALKPLNSYASSKALAEELVVKVNSDALIIRCNFFGWGPIYRASFSDFIYYNLVKGKKINLANDYFYTPISTYKLNETIHELIKKNASGIFNVVGSDRVSKLDFGLELSDIFKLDRKLIRSVNWNDLKMKTIRPVDMSLSDKKIKTFLGKNLGSTQKNIEHLKNQFNSNLYKKVRAA